MAIDQYRISFFKRWKLILFFLIIGGLVAYGVSRYMTPLYQATALVQIAVRSQENQADINGLLASDQLVQTEAQLAISDPVLRAVAAQYPGLTVNQLARNVSAVAKPNTQLFEIDVLDPSPQRAARVANSIANVLISQQASTTQQNQTDAQRRIQQQIKSTQQQIDSTEKQIVALETQREAKIEAERPASPVAVQAPQGGVESEQISTLHSKLDSLYQDLREWQSTQAQLELNGMPGGSFLHLAQSAQQPITPTRPNVLLNTAIGLLAGLVNGLLLSMLLEKLDTRVRTEEALTQLVSWPILTTVWRQKPVGKKKRKQEGHDEHESPEYGANIEAFRMLRTSIGLSMVEGKLRFLMVASATPHDGKSLIAANLAIFMAKTGKKTLLIDADLRRPTLETKFHLKRNLPGLSNAIIECNQRLLEHASSMVPVQDIVLTPYMHDVGVPNLQVMPSGPLPANPPELLDSKTVEQFFLALARSDIEVILFDTPPLLGLSDAGILLQKLDAVLIVVDMTSANKKNLKRVDTLLQQSGKTILGCVVNKKTLVRKDLPYTYPYYYYREGKQPKEDASDFVFLQNASSNTSEPAETDESVQKKELALLPVIDVPPVQPAPRVVSAPQIADTRKQTLLAARPRTGFLPLSDGLRLYYEVIGDGSTPILVPAACWLAADLTPLAQDHMLICYDQRGRGRSDSVDEESLIGIQHEINDLDAVRRFFELETCSLIGWSYLAGVAALYAVEHPAVVERLLLVAPIAPRFHQYDDPRVFDPDERVNPQSSDRVAAMQAAGIDISDPVTYNRVYAKLTRLPRQMGNPSALVQMKSDPWLYPNEWPDAISAFFARLSSSLGEWDWRSQLATLEKPVLIVHGTEDLIPVASSREWCETLPDARLLSLPNAGHYPWLEDPDTFFAAAGTFFKGEWPLQAATVREAVAVRKRR